MVAGGEIVPASAAPSVLFAQMHGGTR